MKALVVKEFGGPLILEEVAVPRPAADQVLIRVKACAVDQFDLTIRDGKFRHGKPRLRSSSGTRSRAWSKRSART